MLAVTRRITTEGDGAKERRIMIGTDIIVTIIRIRPGAVTVGIQAPKGVVIAREELLSDDEVKAIEAAAAK
jgi:carbon storage regulator CsrA